MKTERAMLIEVGHKLYSSWTGERLKLWIVLVDVFYLQPFFFLFFLNQCVLTEDNNCFEKDMFGAFVVRHYSCLWSYNTVVWKKAIH